VQNHMKYVHSFTWLIYIYTTGVCILSPGFGGIPNSTTNYIFRKTPFRRVQLIILNLTDFDEHRQIFIILMILNLETISSNCEAIGLSKNNQSTESTE
jgi:hypothetical protein